MAIAHSFETVEPARRVIDEVSGPVVVEFGAPWCGYCRAAIPLIERAFEQHTNVRHIKIEDGSGLPLGRSFKVKLWPTLIFMRDGEEIARLVRPADSEVIEQALSKINNDSARVDN